MPGKTVRDRADIIQAMGPGTSDCPMQPHDPGYDGRLTEGDSWLTIGAIPS